MAEHSAGSGEPRWLLEPRPGEAQIHVAVGEGAEITPELRAAIDALARALPQEEVAGYATPRAGPDRICTQDLTAPCTQYIACRIGG